MNRLIIACLSVCLFYSPVTFSQQEILLDFVKAQRQLAEQRQRTPAKREADGAPKWVSPKPYTSVTHLPVASKLFEITLLSLDKQSYRIGQDCIYEIRLRNVADTQIDIPSSLDTGNSSTSITANLNLLLIDGKSEMPVNGISMSGPSVTLKPKESVRIRALARFAPANLTYEGAIFSTLPRRIEVRAYYDPAKRPANWPIENSLSDNKLTVELTK